MQASSKCIFNENRLKVSKSRNKRKIIIIYFSDLNPAWFGPDLSRGISWKPGSESSNSATSTMTAPSSSSRRPGRGSLNKLYEYPALFWWKSNLFDNLYTKLTGTLFEGYLGILKMGYMKKFFWGLFEQKDFFLKKSAKYNSKKCYMMLYF